MNNEEATTAAIETLNALAIPYMLVGSFATCYYGAPRCGGGADFLIEIRSDTISHLARQLGPDFTVIPQTALATATGELRYEVHVTGATFNLELFPLSRDTHDLEQFARRVPRTLLGRPAWLPTAEDVIITKLRWALLGHRSKDRDDARDVLAVQGDALDWGYIHAWCDRHGTRALLDEIRRSIPPI